MNLSEMIKTGPDPARGIGALVLRRYKDIELARQQRWRWAEIAEGLGLPATRGPALAEAFNRATRRIAEKKLKPIDAPAPAATGGTAAKPRTTAATGTPAAAPAPVAPGYHPSGRRLAPGETLRDDGLDF